MQSITYQITQIRFINHHNEVMLSKCFRMHFKPISEHRNHYSVLHRYFKKYYPDMLALDFSYNLSLQGCISSVGLA